MASKAHQFIADLISRKIEESGYEVVSFEGVNSFNIKYKLPPKIIRHRPDIIGYKSGKLIIGEAKTKKDITTRTTEQIVDFVNLINDNLNYCYLILGFPLSIENKINKILNSLSFNHQNIYLLSVPDDLIPND